MRNILIVFILLTFFSCENILSQEVKDQIIQNESYWKIRTNAMNKNENTTEYPIKKDTTLNEERTNRIYLRSRECQFEILVNDVILFNLKGEITKRGGGITGGYDTNQLLLTSGIHEVEVRIYPKHGLQVFDEYVPFVSMKFYQFKDRDFKNEHYNEKMGGSDGVELSGSDVQWIGEKGIYGESSYVEGHYAPKPPIKFEGLPIYVWRSTFEAEVPFDLVGWRNSINLKKEQDDEKINIKAELYEEYKKAHQIVKNRDISAYLSLVKEREELITTALYYRPSEKKEREALFVEMLKNTDYEIEPLFEETFQLEYQAYGKLGMLLHKADGEGIIRLRNKKDPDDVVYLDFKYQRKKKGDTLTVI